MSDIIGTKELIKQLSKLQDDIQNKAIVTATRESAKQLRDKAIMYAPIETGTLRDNIKALKMPKRLTRRLFGNDAVAYVVGVTKIAWYGVFAEIGTKYHAPDPFMYPAAKATEPYIIKDMKENLLKAIKKYKKD